MPRWCALKIRLDCPECGSVVLGDGPYKKLPCAACGASVTLTSAWKRLVASALSDGGRGGSFRLGTVTDIEGAEGLGSIYLAMSTGHPPVCSECQEVLDEVDTDVDDGRAGNFHCHACGAAHPTWPAPGHLAKAGVLQVFMAPPMGARQPAAASAEVKPVLFSCSNCGGKLEITEESRRITTCSYCDVDLYLPPEIWHRMHPVRRRRAFWLRCR